MKTAIVLLLLSAQYTAAQDKPDIEKLHWLTTTWNRIDVKPGGSATETWRRNGDALIGTGITKRGSDTVFVEKLKIIVRDGGLFYVADVPDNKEPVYFRFTELTSAGFTCENAAHDFPKRISYRKENDLLIATISGDGKSITYRFARN